MSGHGGYYDDDGNWRGHDDDTQTVDGYKCDRCGYLPTIAELNRGTCPGCRLNSDLNPSFSEGDTE